MKEKICKWKAACTWGDGPDVLLVHEKDNKYSSSYDLTAKEAKELANRLIIAANIADDMEQSAQDYFEQEEIDKETLDMIKKF